MLSHQLVSAQHHLRVISEEVFVLRRAQYDCSNMANDIYVYQQCVEAQRAELARATPLKDADVGVMEMLQQLSHLQKKNELEARNRMKEQMRHMKEELHQLNLRVTTLSTDHPTRVEHAELVHLRERVTALEENLNTQVALRKQADAERSAAYADRDRLSVCVDEQRRHMVAMAEQPGFLNPDTGVISLMESVRQQAVVEYNKAAMKEMQTVHALHAELATAREEATRLREETTRSREEATNAHDETGAIKSMKEEVEAMREVIERQRADLVSYDQKLTSTSAEVRQLQAELNAAPQPVDVNHEEIKEKLVEVQQKNEQLVELLATVTARERKYVSDIQVLTTESEVSAQRVRTMVQRHLVDRSEMQKRLESVTEHRVTLQREVCRLGMEKQVSDARARELQAEVEYGKRLSAAFKDMQDVFARHNFFQAAMKEEAANHSAKMLELECTRESISPQNKTKRKNKKN